MQRFRDYKGAARAVDELREMAGANDAEMAELANSELPEAEAKATQLLEALKDEFGIGLCNITKCCTEVCPEDIHITDNAIIPLKERVVDEYYDPILRLVRKIRGAE